MKKYSQPVAGRLAFAVSLRWSAGTGQNEMQTIETRVDSEAARYYLGSYLAGERNDAALNERIDRVYQSANGPEGIYRGNFLLIIQNRDTGKNRLACLGLTTIV